MNVITDAEEPRHVPGLEGICEATAGGMIFSAARGIQRKNGSTYSVKRRLLSQKTTASGYKSVAFWIDGKRKMFLVHRLVMLAFVEADSIRHLVNHKNGVRHDNRLENLEWCTKSENSTHAFRVLGRAHGMSGRLGDLHSASLPIRGIDQRTGDVKDFAGLMDAQRQGYRASCISECLHGTQKTHRGMRWETNIQGI